MPTKNIYIKEENLDTFEKAEKMFEKDSLSQIIVDSLEKYMELEKAKKQEMKEHTLKIGYFPNQIMEKSDYKEVKFYGKEIAVHNQFSGETSQGDDRGTELTLYKTRKGKFLLLINHYSNWQNEESNTKYFVYDTLEEVENNSKTTNTLIREAKEELKKETAEFLDI